MFTRLDYSSALEYSIIRRYTNIVYYYYYNFSNLSYSFGPDMVSKCDLCNKTFKSHVNLEDILKCT